MPEHYYNFRVLSVEEIVKDMNLEPGHLFLLLFLMLDGREAQLRSVLRELWDRMDDAAQSEAQIKADQYYRGLGRSL